MEAEPSEERSSGFLVSRPAAGSPWTAVPGHEPWQEVVLDLVAGSGQPSGDKTHDIGVGVEAGQLLRSDMVNRRSTSRSVSRRTPRTAGRSVMCDAPTCGEAPFATKRTLRRMTCASKPRLGRLNQSEDPRRSGGRHCSLVPRPATFAPVLAGRYGRGRTPDPSICGV